MSAPHPTHVALSAAALPADGGMLDPDGLFAIEDALIEETDGGALSALDPQQVLLPRLREYAPTVEALAVLAPSQRDLFVHHVRDPDDTTYVLGFGIALQADLDADRWIAALRSAERAAPTLRSRYVEFAEAFFQVLDNALVPPVEIVRLDDDDPAAVARVTQAALDRPFDLFDGAARHLLILGNERARAVLICHHIAIDAVSAALFFRHALAAYAGTAVPEDLAVLDWATQAAAGDQAPTAWQAILGGVQPLLPDAGDSSETVQEARLEPDVVKALASWGRPRKLPLAAVLKYLTALLLARECAATRDYLLHDVIAARTAGQSTLIGCLYRILPIRCAPPDPDRDELAAGADAFQRRMDEALALPAVSMLALSALTRPAGAPVYLNFFDHIGITPLLRSARGPVDADPGGPRLSFHDRIGATETHVVYERDAAGLQIRVRTRHPSLDADRLASGLAGAARRLIDGATRAVQLWSDDAVEARSAIEARRIVTSAEEYAS